MNAPLTSSLAGHPVRILHQSWNDQRFQRFGARIGSRQAPLTSEHVAELLVGERRDETRRLLTRLGFLVIEVENFHPEQLQGLAWDRLVNDRNRLPDVNMMPHTDFADVVLFAQSKRRSRTGLSGRTGIAQSIVDALPSIEPFAAEIRLCVPEIRSQIQLILRESLDYEDPLPQLLQELHRSLSDLLAFQPEASWKFWQALYRSMEKRKLHHSHLWKGGQVLMISSQALHFREVPQVELLIDPVPMWRAQIDHDFEEAEKPRQTPPSGT